MIPIKAAYFFFISFTIVAQTVKIGEKTPNFKIWFVDGTSITQNAIKGKTVVFKFWFTSCQACLMDLAELNILVDTYKNNTNVLFLAPALDDKQTIERFLKRWDFRFRPSYGAYETAKTFNPKGVYPTYVIIDNKGIVRYIDSKQKQSNIATLSNALREIIP